MKFAHCFLLLVCLLTACGQSSKPSSTSLRIGAEDDAGTLDPRQARYLHTVTLMHAFFEGLMHYDREGKLRSGMSERVEISPDQKTYTFTLRPAQWSNGETVTAADFAETWASMLQPSFPAPNAYQLYVIKGAKALKEGKGSLQDFGVHAKDDHTLVVELENPVPYFLDLTASHFYFPVHRSWRKERESSAISDPSQWVSNGPFILQSWKRHHELSAAPNPRYWDNDAVHLKQITLMQLDENTALRMLENGELDWAGSPLGTIPTDAVPVLKKEGLLKTQDGAGTHWFRVNTMKPPFDNLKMRKAFGLALDRKAIVDHVSQGNQKPALAIVPPSLGLLPSSYLIDHDVQTARQYFSLALQEMGIDKEKLPTITLSYSQSERNHKIAQAVQQQWNKAFGITVELQGGESKFITDKVKKGEYQLALGSWFADFADPINFLEVFKTKSNPTNQTGWENPEYVHLLNQSALVADPDKRKTLLSNAEKVIMEDMPVIPIFYSTFIYAASPEVQGVYFSELGYLDFKFAEIK